jgi:filamentous hemagglutinin family protein
LVLFIFTSTPLFAEESTALAEPTIVVDTSLKEHAATVKQTSAGIPQIDIINPKDGLSHNRFVEYGVAERGVVINNSRFSDMLEGAGHLAANPNLRESAKTILFEVTGTGRSDLKGPSVIAGDPAKFILVNPNGISCNGGSFINTHDVELRAEKLLANNSGKLSYVESNGEVIVGQRGIAAPEASLLLSGNKIKIRGGGDRQRAAKTRSQLYQIYDR